MSAPACCPQCRTELPAGAPDGLCPRCLLQVGLQASTPLPAPPLTAAYPPPGDAPTPHELQPLFPQLEILELLGRGGMGAVYRARQLTLDRVVAVKVLPPRVGADPAFAERFTREARVLARLNHPHIVGVHDFGQAGGLYYFVMEYVDGINVRQALRAGRLSPEEALRIVPQICDALQYAHDEGIVHRDIKPENVLLDRRGRVKIADFGLAKLLDASAGDLTLTGTQQVMGTLHYMAPEQVQATHAVDHRADIYSLGVMFYEMLTGELPLGRFPPPSARAPVDARLDPVVLRTLEREPAERYQHASDVKTEVESIARDRPAPDVPTVSPIADRPPLPAPPNYWILVALPSLCLLVGYLLLTSLSVWLVGLDWLVCAGAWLLVVAIGALHAIWLARTAPGPSTTDPDATAPQPARPAVVPVFAGFDLAFAVLLPVLMVIELALFLAQPAPHIEGPAGLRYIAILLFRPTSAAALALSGVGLLRWRRWGRRVAVIAPLLVLALTVLETGLGVAALFRPILAGGEPPAVRMFLRAPLGLLVLGLPVLFFLAFLVLQIVLLSRPEVVAAFDRDPHPIADPPLVG